MKKDDLLKQAETPYLTAYNQYLKEKSAVFDVPGHHQGKIRTDFDKVFGKSIYKYDVNAPSGMDNLLRPKGVIKKAQDLMALATGADYTKFLVNGSTSGIITMLLATLRTGDKIIMPRNVHKSAINGLILSGAIPIFINPCIDNNMDIINQNTYNEWKKMIDLHPEAKAIFLINPTYYGATLNLKKITEYAHLKGLVVLVDEAHGSHFYFSNKTPITAMKAGADISTISFHKTGGSLTQSSVLLVKGERVSKDLINKSFNLITTTSPSSYLLASLDSARKFMVFKGGRYILNAIKLAKETRERISEIPGFIARDKKYFKDHDSFNYDETKVVVEINNLSINGFDVYKILRERFKIQIELAETYVFLLLFTVGSTSKDVDILVKALTKISNKYYKEDMEFENHHYLTCSPPTAISPRRAYHAPLKVVKLRTALDRISKEMIMIYPPGIPIIIPGERFTKEIISELLYFKKSHANIVSDWENVNEVSVVDEKNYNKD